MKFTPGPWKEGGTSGVIYEKEDHWIASIVKDQRNWGANFDLILEAPTMFRLLKEALPFLPTGPEGYETLASHIKACLLRIEKGDPTHE